MRRAVRILLTVIVVFWMAAMSGGYLWLRSSFPVYEGVQRIAGLSAPVQVYRDPWAVPHIYAATLLDAFRAQGYVQAQDRLWQMDFHRRAASGTLAEILGPEALEDDRLMRTLGLRRAAERGWQCLDEASRQALSAFADGVNAYIAECQDKLPLEFRLLEYAPTPWTPLDSLAIGNLMAWGLDGTWRHELILAQLVQAVGAERAAELVPAYPADASCIVPTALSAQPGSHPSLPADVASSGIDWESLPLLTWEFPEVVAASEQWGSNSWVVAGERTATGAPMLANDPHLSLQMPSLWYENQLVAQGANGDIVLDVKGASLPGMPGVIIGHNQQIAWGLTNVGADAQDLYVEQLNPDDPSQYRDGDIWSDLEIVTETIRVQGETEPVIEQVRISRHGPLLPADLIREANAEEGAASTEFGPLALQWTALQGNTIVRSILMLNQAEDWTSFRDALRWWVSPAQNVVYADRAGNIGYQLAGRIPLRARGHGMVPVAGWTGDAAWIGEVPFESLPHLYNPPDGIIVTANNQVAPEGYTYHIASAWAAPYRAERIRELLIRENPLEIEDMIAIQGDIQGLAHTHILPYLLALEPEGWLQEVAWPPLQTWDGQYDESSIGATIYEAFQNALARNVFADELGAAFAEYHAMPDLWVPLLANLMADPDNAWFDDVHTPQREGRDDILRRSIAEGLEFVGGQFGDIPKEWRWGRLHIVAFEHPLGQEWPLDWLLSRGPYGVSGSSMTVNVGIYQPQKRYWVRAAPSYRQIIDLHNWDNSLSIHTTGQSGHVWTRLPWEGGHYADFIEAWREVRYHPMLYSREAVLVGQPDGTAGEEPVDVMVLQP